MAETILIDEVSVDAAASCDVVSFVVPADAQFVTFRVACGEPHTLKFYGAEKTFDDITAAGCYQDETRTYVSPTTGTNGNLWHIDPGPRGHVACVATNNGTSAVDVTVAAEAVT